MNLSFRIPRTSGLAQVSRFMMWHHRHHQDCNETITNLFSREAFAKVTSLHSLQKPSLLLIGAAPALAASNSDRTKKPKRIMEISRVVNGQGHSVRLHHELNSQGCEPLVRV